MYGQKYSRTTISNLTNVALEEVKKWKERSLEKRYSVIFIDGMSIKVRRDTVANESVYIIIGINEDGYPKVTQSWYKDKDELLAFYKYPESIHKAVYTTNWIERANKEIRKRLKPMNSLPNVQAAEKILYLKIIEYNSK